MSRATSPSSHRVYGAASVCRIWGVARATLYRHRAASLAAANDAGPLGRRGPGGLQRC